MRNVKLILLTTFVLGAIFCFSQENLVEYYFSKEINSEIDKYISQQLESDTTMEFYLTIYRKTRFKEAGNCQIVVGTINEETPNETVTKLIKASGRYYPYQDYKKIPIIFDYDFEFTKHGEDVKGRPIRKIIMSHSYFIQFEPRSGKVVKTGY